MSAYRPHSVLNTKEDIYNTVLLKSTKTIDDREHVQPDLLKTNKYVQFSRPCLPQYSFQLVFSIPPAAPTLKRPS